MISGSANEGAPGAPTGGIGPEWVLEQHRNQQEINAQIMQSLRAVQESLASFTPTPSQITVPIVQKAEPTRKAKHSLSHPDKYDGRNKTAYPAFKGHLRAKLRIDRAAIGGEPEQVWYAFGRLADKAADRIFPWIESTEQRGGPLRVTAFFEQLDAAFYDPQIPQRALEWINNKKQGGTPFRDFLQEFEQKLLEAGGWEFSDGIRKGYLKSALNLEIKTQLVAQAEPETYADYVNLVHRTSDNLEIKRLKRKRNGGMPLRTIVDERDTGEQMEWEPTTQVASGKSSNHRRTGPDNRPTAQWVSQKVIESRRENQECLRYGGDDHFIRECRYGPAKQSVPKRNKPHRNKLAVSTTRALQETPSTTRSAFGKAKDKKKALAPAQAEEVEASEWSLESGSENE